jgi:hypothetical protein
MDAKTLAKIVQIVVQEEVGKIVRKEMATLKKQIVAEVKKSIPKQVIKEPVYEHGQSQNGWEDMGMDIPDVLPQRESKQYTKNQALNSILNETSGFDGGGQDDYPTMGGGPVTSNNAMGGNVSDFRAMMAEKMGMTPPGQKGNLTVQEMMPTTNPEGMPIRNQQVPDAVAKALTRDYTDLVKAMKK